MKRKVPLTKVPHLLKLQGMSTQITPVSRMRMMFIAMAMCNRVRAAEEALV
ncbi:MAG: hypothetical protein MUP03_02505 [Anaerolineales bacterium]|nr:hypothetical protein [Anaerolineales bacterium]